jgi:GAF domain-containing protein
VASTVPNDTSNELTDHARQQRYAQARASLASLLDTETDWIAALATIVAELHQALPYFAWTGFYRVIAHELLVIGPYQGGHGCLRIAFSRGVCGAAARTKLTQLVDDVNQRADHIACATTTRSEIVVPVLSPTGDVLAVLDVDSDQLAAFNAIDRAELEALCAALGARFPLGDPARTRSDRT